MCVYLNLSKNNYKYILLNYILFVLFTVFLGTVFGLLFGIISGIIPGLHINNVIYLVSNINLSIEIKAIIFILASIIFSFVSFIPATLLSIPNTDNFVSTLPSQRLVIKGNAYYAIKLYIIGAINGIIFGLPIIILFILLLQYLTETIKFLTPFILVIGLIALIFNVKNYFGYLVILFSALVGFFALNYAFVENPLLVVISGLFGISNILYLMQNKIKIPKQNLKTKEIDIKTKIKTGIIGTCLSVFVTLFPGIGNGFATYIGTKVSQLKDEGYILLNGAINILVMVLSFFSVLFIGKARTASAVFFKEYTKNTFVFSLPWVIIFILIAIVIGYFLTDFLGKMLSLRIHKINYKTANFVIIVFLNLIVILFSNILGLIVFWLSGLIGYLCIKTKNPRILMLPTIIVPVLIYFI